MKPKYPIFVSFTTTKKYTYGNVFQVYVLSLASFLELAKLTKESVYLTCKHTLYCIKNKSLQL
jgi:hypothetical protein